MGVIPLSNAIEGCALSKVVLSPIEGCALSNAIPRRTKGVLSPTRSKVVLSPMRSKDVLSPIEGCDARRLKGVSLHCDPSLAINDARRS